MWIKVPIEHAHLVESPVTVNTVLHGTEHILVAWLIMDLFLGHASCSAIASNLMMYQAF